MKKILLKLVVGLLAVFAVAFGLFLMNKNFSPTGEMAIMAVLGQDRPAISRIGPPPRQKLVDGVQIILDSPVYFDVRVLPWFNQARIEITYQEEARKLTELGGNVGGEWQYYLVKPFLVSQLEDNWQKAIFILDLNLLSRPKNMARFLISTTGLPQDQLKIRELKVILWQ